TPTVGHALVTTGNARSSVSTTSTLFRMNRSPCAVRSADEAVAYRHTSTTIAARKYAPKNRNKELPKARAASRWRMTTMASVTTTATTGAYGIIAPGGRAMNVSGEGKIRRK